LALTAALILTVASAAVPATAAGTAGSGGSAATAAAVDDGVLDSAVDTHHHHQHGANDGHLPPTSSNVRVVGKQAVNQDLPGRVADVGVFGNHAYLAAFWEPSCQKGGVYVFDINNLSKPKQINFIRTSNDSYVGEGVHVVHIDTPAFNGDVLAFNNEICGAPNQHSNGGMTLVDVTNPKVHKYLSEHAGDVAPDGTINEIHSVFIWDAGDKAYAVLVDDEEDADVDIMDITDPRNPKMVREYDLAALFPQILQPTVGLDSVFHHDMVVKKIGDRWMMLVSYWDAGYVVLDVTDPANATYVADSDFKFPDPEAAESGLTVDPEGNGHEAEFTLDNRYIVAADEDFTAYKGKVTNTDEGTTFDAIQGDAVPGVPPGGSINGQTVYVGRACPGDPAVPAGDGTQIALVERGVCDFQVKYDAILAAGGYRAVLVFNREQGSADGCDTLITMLLEGDVPAFFVTRRVGFDLLDVPYDHAACLAGDGSVTAPAPVGTVGDRLSMTSTFDGWGYVHLYANTGGKLAELDTYAIPEAHDPAFGTGFGDLSVHEAAASAVNSRLMYFSYYAGGFRVVRITDDGKLVEVGRFIDTGGNNFWGVQVFSRGGKEYVAASDRDYGLYILKYTPKRHGRT
jgi:hypothetical protein